MPADLNDDVDHARLLIEGGDFGTAAAILTRAVSLDPQNRTAWRSIGAVMLRLRRYDDAIAAYSNALTLDAADTAALSGLGETLRRRGLPDHALTFLDMAISLAPANAETRRARALALLASGDYPKGFAEYNWCARDEAEHAVERPRWTGEPLEGRTLLVHEGGDLGDTIQFARYLPLLAHRGGRVLLRVRPTLASLLSRMEGVDAVTITGGQTPPYDLTCPITNLPLLFGTTVHTIPASACYFTPDPVRVEHWRGRLMTDTIGGRRPRLRVGLAWAGGSRPARDASLSDQQRSTGLTTLAPLAAASSDVLFYSLQVEDGTRGVDPPIGLCLVDHTALIQTFDDLAALVRLLDLVITVEASIAHLAGALGRPVWVLSPYERCWRWPTGRDDTPWYANTRLYTQPVPNDWTTPVARMATDLAALASPADHAMSAFAHHQAGLLPEAVAAYTSALEREPDRPELHNNLGNALRQLGHYTRAKSHFERALALKPDFAGALYNLGSVCADLAEWDQAVIYLYRASTLQPDFAQAHYNLGNVLFQKGLITEAIRAYQKAIALKPDFAEAYNNLANVLIKSGDLEQAITCLTTALALKPDYADALVNLGCAFRDRDRLDEAISCFGGALAIAPDLRQAHNNLGTALQAQGELEAAARSFRTALALKPDYVEAHINLGDTLRQQEQLVEAVECYDKALALAPASAPAHNGRGNALRGQGALAAAVDSYRQAIACDPDYAEAYNNLGNALKDQGLLAEAIQLYKRATALKPDYFAALSNEIFTRNYLKEPPEALRDLARHYGALAAARAHPFTAWRNPATGSPLRVGMVSSDLRCHPVGFFLEALLGAADPARLTFLAFPSHHGQDELTARIRPRFAAWTPIIGLSDEAAARLIHASDVDVLLDLSGHTAHNRLPVFAWRPAPVQATWLGYFATTGVTAIDAIIADPNVVPSEEDHHFTEAVWRLPDIYYCFSPPTPAVAVSPLPALCGGVPTFGCFNNLTKLNDGVLAVWSRVLHAVPNSRLILKAPQLRDAGVAAATRARFARHDIEGERLVLEQPSSRAEYLRAYHQIDIALDPFPYPGGTTSFEALWMGVPVLTRQGDRFLSHAGETIMRNAGLPDWIASDDDDYVAHAVRFAGDTATLARLRAGLRDQIMASPLFDAPRFARHFEAAVQGLWAKRRQ